MLILYLVGREATVMRDRLLERFQHCGIRCVALDFHDAVKVAVAQKYHLRFAEVDNATHEYTRFLIQKEEMEWQRENQLYDTYDAWITMHGFGFTRAMGYKWCLRAIPPIKARYTRSTFATSTVSCVTLTKTVPPITSSRHSKALLICCAKVSA
jgi:hypothetical protein